MTKRPGLHDTQRAVITLRQGRPGTRWTVIRCHTFEAMLTQPLVISYYDQLYAGEGIAVGKPAT